MARKRITKQTKEEIFAEFKKGTPTAEIAERFEIKPTSIGAYLTDAKRKGIIPQDAYRKGPLPAKHGESISTARKRGEASASASEGNDGMGAPTKTQPTTATGDGMAGATGKTTYGLERVIPHDGYLGTYTAPFHKDDIGKLYGSGRYRVTRTTPGQHTPDIFDVDISKAFGAPKYPATHERSSQREGSQEEMDVRRARAGWPHDPYAGRGGRQDEGALAAMAGALGRIAEGSGTPKDEGNVRDFFGKMMHDRDQQNRNDRESERERYERHRQEERERRENAEKEREAAHKREIERIEAQAKARKEEEEANRKSLMDLEEKKMELLRQETKTREQLVLSELKAAREDLKTSRELSAKEIKDAQEAAAEQIATSTQSLKAELTAEKKRQEMEMELRRDMLKLEGRLETEKLELLKKVHAVDQSGLLLETIQTVGKRAEAIFDRIIEAKKLDVGAKGADAGSAPSDGDLADGAEEHHESTEAGSTTNGNGNNTGDARMKILDQILDSPLFQDIVVEWAEQIRRGQDASLFANMFLEWMRDPDPNQAETRKACSMFANYMAPRSWAEMRERLDPKVSDEIKAVFDMEHAENFFNTFRTIVHESILEWAEDFVRARQEQRAARQQAAQAEEQPKEEPAATER